MMTPVDFVLFPSFPSPCGGNSDPLLQRQRWAPQGETTDLPEAPLLLSSKTRFHPRAVDSRGQDLSPRCGLLL